jgi:hypothetical protein
MMAAKRRRHLVCPVAKDGYHVWQAPEAKHDLGAMFAECRICGAVLWTPKGVIVSDPPRGMVFPHAKRTFPQHITEEVAATPGERGDADASTPEV